MKFVDELKLNLIAGNGGNGIVAWRREPNVPEGGPWGGDGGKGGSIIFVGNHNENTLFPLTTKKNIIAPNGGNGQTQMATGAAGKDIYINVPLGTSIYDSDTNELLCDILHHNQQYLCCQGGKAGHGNAYFKSSFNRIPTLHENGDIGQKRNVLLKLKFIADVGIIGLPNAGKSSLINLISNANSKIGNYPFTTIYPVLGVCNIDNNNKFVIADIPGLIEDAHSGKGLGIEFLKHIERCQMIVHLISLAPEDNGDGIIKSYQTINNELMKYSSEITKKPFIIVTNKCDTYNAKQNYDILAKFLKDKNLLSISCLEKTNIKKFNDLLIKKYIELKNKTNEINIVVPLEKKVSRKQEDDLIKIDQPTIKFIRDGVWMASSKYLDYWFNRIPLDTPDNIIRFNQKITSSMAESFAKKQGAISGQTIIINNVEFIIE